MYCSSKVQSVIAAGHIRALFSNKSTGTRVLYSVSPRTKWQIYSPRGIPPPNSLNRSIPGGFPALCRCTAAWPAVQCPATAHPSASAAPASHTPGNSNITETFVHVAERHTHDTTSLFGACRHDHALHCTALTITLHILCLRPNTKTLLALYSNMWNEFATALPGILPKYSRGA